MSKIYLVMQEHDDVVMAAFSDFDEAEHYLRYHNLDRIDEFELNPTVPVTSEVPYACFYRYRDDYERIDRISIGELEDQDNELHWHENAEYGRSVCLTVWAHDREEACQKWAEILKAVNEGRVTPAPERA